MKKVIVTIVLAALLVAGCGGLDQVTPDKPFGNLDPNTVQLYGDALTAVGQAVQATGAAAGGTATAVWGTVIMGLGGVAGLVAASLKRKEKNES